MTTTIISDCTTATECDDSLCHMDPSEYCTHTCYPENTYECREGTGCSFIGTSGCLEGCHYKDGILCCCVRVDSPFFDNYPDGVTAVTASSTASAVVSTSASTFSLSA